MAFLLSLLFVSVIILLGFVDKAFPCQARVQPNGCCHDIIFGCSYNLDAKCNLFGYNCVACDYYYEPGKCDVAKTLCSCYYCCDSQYAKTCPDGCANCIKDGEGGCPQNRAASALIRSSINSDHHSSTYLLPLGPAAQNDARVLFDTIDVDESGGISQDEAIAYWVKANNGTSAAHLAKNTSWFDGMDTNGNGRIEPVEFDRSLG